MSGLGRDPSDRSGTSGDAHLVAGPALAAGGIAVLGVWLAGVLYTLVYGYAWALPHQSLLWRGQSPGGPANHLPAMLGIPADAYLTGAGIILLCAAPWLTRTVAVLDARTARALLGPSRTEELEHQVQRLAQTRADVVDAADAERRRLERDLHDGTQQRLVSLAMNLGMARAEVTTAQQAKDAIAAAHEEAKAALTELRNLIRGLHPAVLEDRGLDAALSGVAARMPVPVRLTVDLPRRPPPVIEAVAYFVVSEALTNVAKHAQASQAEVFVQCAGDRLHVIISDDGAGRRRPGRRHRPGRAGQPRVLGRRDLRDRQPARRADADHRGPAMRPVARAGRWAWGLCGLATAAALAVPGTRLIVSAGDPPGPASSSRPGIRRGPPGPTQRRGCRGG